MPDIASASADNLATPENTRSTGQLPPVRLRLTRLLESARWKHAIGEIVLIVLGVLIALAVNNWNASRQQRQVELTVLAQLRAALVGDLTALRAVDTVVRVREKRIEALLADLDQGIVTGDSADVRFGAVLRIWGLRLNRSVYETLKAKGLDLISNDSLRLRVAALYDHTYVDLDQSQADDRSTVFDLVRPYYLTNFRNIRFGESATPLNNAAVARDPLFRNLVDYRLASLRANPIASIEGGIQQVSGLIAALDTAMARHH